ncbi:TrmH family RNA methyltransferase [Vagococcus fessus]|uniref:23S rRNA methyltransferase n=1 Tax=Vagococcus fessus TaxID=120370 RepID=A0A430ACV5_9ENTE|nr:RNA methyltransferase [Vagococcus fessus]RSU05055.1 23S rRNA methyltransferase [Vagococcus fessus]
MKEITSTKNAYIKELKKLDKKKYRDETNRYIVEGEHLVQEAIKAGASIESVLYTETGQTLFEAMSKVVSTVEEEYIVTEEVMKTLSSVPAPQGIMAVVRKEKEEEIPKSGTFLLLDGVQDPGNVGTMIRTADAAGIKTVILGEGTTDIYNAKVLRSMQGSHFHVTVRQAVLTEVIAEMKETNIPVYGTELNPEAVSYRTVEKTSEFALVMGNEGQGVSEEVLALTDKKLYIPIVGQAESLNVAIAAGILMFSLT